MSTDVDINVIAENLTELLQNTINMTSVFYDIFINPTPMDVTLTQFNADGELVTISVPNRAKDMQRALTGSGSPDGVIEAAEGTLYIDEQAQAVYIKVLGSDANGWKIVLTEEGVYAYVRNYLENSDYLDTFKLAQYLTNNEYTTETRVGEMIADSSKVVYLDNLPSSGTILLEDGKSYKLTATGGVTFVLPSVRDLTKLHTIFIQFKVIDGENMVLLGTNYFFNKINPDFSIAGMYDIRYEYDNLNGVWVCEVALKGAGEYISIPALYDKVNNLGTIGDADITIQRNGVAIGTINANQTEDGVINVSVPTTASDIGALSSTTTITDLASTTQMEAIDSGINSTIVAQVGTNASNISDIEGLIPLQATTSNQLTDRNFVNSSIATSTATFRGTFSSVAALEAYSGDKDNNDYAFVTGTDSDGNTYYDRYKYNGTAWVFEYRLNNSSFTAAQWAAISSGIDASGVTQIATNTSDITDLSINKQDKLTAGNNISISGNTISATDTTYSNGSGLNLTGTIFSVNFTEVATAAQGAKADSALQSVPIASTGTLGGIKIGNNLTITADGTLSAVAEQMTVDSTLSTTSTNPVQNKVITAAINDKQDVLTAGAGITINNNTITATGTSVLIDSTLSTTSTNPVQNKVITAAINNLQSDKQDVLTAGAGITISGNTITATGTSVLIDSTMSTTSVNPVQNKVITSALENRTVATFTNITEATSADVTNLKVNTLTSAEYATITPSDTELYFITDANSSITIDTSLSTTSTNPVENRVITQALNGKGTLVTSISANSTDSEYPSAKCVYDLLGGIYAILDNIAGN